MPFNTAFGRSLLIAYVYKLIHQGSKCTRHGGLIIYLHEEYIYI